MTKETPPIVFKILAFIGILMTILFIFCIYRDVQFYRTAVSVPGMITGLEARTSKDSDGNSSTTYAYKVKYTLQDGKEAEFVSSSSSSHPSYSEGDPIGVRYIPGTRNARVDGWFDSWGGSLISGLFFIVFVFIGFSPAIITRGEKNMAKRKEALVQFGLKLTARFIRVKTVMPGMESSSDDDAMMNAYQIIVELNDPLTGLPKEYESEIFWATQKPAAVPIAFDVYIDQKNPKNFWVDITDIQKAAELQQEAAMDKIIQQRQSKTAPTEQKTKDESGYGI